MLSGGEGIIVAEAEMQTRGLCRLAAPAARGGQAGSNGSWRKLVPCSVSVLSGPPRRAGGRGRASRLSGFRV